MGSYLGFQGRFTGTHADARAGISALESGDLVALHALLIENRGQPDFVYYFTSGTTPRSLGDAIATVAGASKEEPLKPDIHTHVYELILTDLAGALSLATHGTDDRALPDSWTDDFITATTDPIAIYGKHGGFFDGKGKQRERQDKANRSNLLLLLARGYWSFEFLQATTQSYYAFDRQEGDNAWPEVQPSDQVGYAPGPSGAYLTDGVLALTAALTANPAASEWAFTKFEPGNVQVEGTDYSLGKFTHFLMFEHRFPDAGGEPIGSTATLTALSSAIDSMSWALGPQSSAHTEASAADLGPMHDAITLRALAQELVEESGCSPSPMDWGNCAVSAVKAVWRWMRHWGHVVLDVLTLATFAPPPFNVIGGAAAATNATWYAIEGDYMMAGLSLAAVVPGLTFSKIAKSVKAGPVRTRAASASDDVAKAAKQVRTSAPLTAQRVDSSAATKAKVLASAPKTARGDFIEPNLGTTIPKDGPYHFGHKPGYEWRGIREKAIREKWTKQMIRDIVNDPSLYQIEDPSSNMSGRFEAKLCAI